MQGRYWNAICYLDTNIFVYLHDEKEPEKREISYHLYRKFLENGKGRISVQVISEWRNTMSKKYVHLVNQENRRNFIRLLAAWNPLVITPTILLQADDLSDRYSLSTYDSIHIQCAIEQGCRYFLSEDMQDGLRIDDIVELCNPYKST